MRDKLKKEILEVKASSFDETALAVFRYQAATNPVYAKFLNLLSVDPAEIHQIEAIPFLPIQFFKSYQIQSNAWSPQTIFTSSGTTGAQTSKHLVKDLSFYQQITCLGFESFYKSIEAHCILALLPSYLERSGSSLVYMADYFIAQSNYFQSGFFLNNLDELVLELQKCQEANIPTLLIGVSFALLDLAEAYPMDLSKVMIMETGGMKGRRKEMTRAELHQTLQEAFQTKAIHSEYGMTEMFSQAYSKGNGIFYSSPTLRVYTREVNDPLSLELRHKTGVINLIDLGNLDSCSFIATDDLGKIYPDGSFEVLGRLDHSDLRGCNLLIGNI